MIVFCIFSMQFQIISLLNYECFMRYVYVKKNRERRYKHGKWEKENKDLSD